LKIPKLVVKWSKNLQIKIATRALARNTQLKALIG